MGLFIRLGCIYRVDTMCLNIVISTNFTTFFINYVDHVTNGPLLFTNGNIYITMSNARVCVSHIE